MSDRILRLPAVKERTGLPRSSIYAYMTTGHFPASIKLGARSVGWRESDINAWIEKRANARGAK